jgi:hypothetical protein
VMQLTDGRLYIIPPINGASPDYAFFSALNGTFLESITFNSVAVWNFASPRNRMSGVEIMDSNPVCFARDTEIMTQHGAMWVQDITAGDLILTMDGGYKPVRWIGSTKITPAAMARNPQFRPIRITAGSLGAGMPANDLIVSPQHRIMVRSKIAERMFGAPEVLIAANKLVSLDGVAIADDVSEVEYFHILFDAHELIIANGIATESLFTGPEAIKSVSNAARREIMALFPQILEPDDRRRPARPIVQKAGAIQNFVLRHHKHGSQVIQA